MNRRENTALLDAVRVTRLASAGARRQDEDPRGHGR
jgi:hypothetical protein